MRIKHRFIINSRNNGFDAVRFLEKEKIKHDDSGPFIIFELFEDQETFEDIQKYLEPYGLLSNPPVAVYTKEEINAAQWLKIRSTWRSLYPQPDEDMNYRFSTYDPANYCEKCHYGLIQKENFVLKKEPNWGSKGFLMINWIQDELFISKKTEAFLQTSGLTGFDIYDVCNKSGRNMEGVKQIYVKNYLDYGLMPQSIAEELHCEKCSNTIFMAQPVIYYDSKVFHNVDCDIVKTREKFGQLTRSSLIFVTHTFYEEITKAKLDRGLLFEPVMLV